MMTDEDVIARAALLLETSRQAPPYKKEAHHKAVYTARVRGRRAVEVMDALYPMMGERRRKQIEAALAARSITPYRVPYATEVAEIVDLKAAGVTRGELAERYEVDRKTINRLVGTYGRRDEALAAAAEVKIAESQIAAATGGNTDLAWFAGIVEGEGSLEASGALRIQMTDEDVMQRIATMMNVKLSWQRPRREHWTAMWTARTAPSRAIELLSHIEGALGERRCRQFEAMRAFHGEQKRRSAERGATGNRNGCVPPTRMVRNLEIAKRLIAGETGPALAGEYGMTHQNIYFIGKKYKDVAACPRGEGSACKAEYTGSNPVAASK